MAAMKKEIVIKQEGYGVPTLTIKMVKEADAAARYQTISQPLDVTGICRVFLQDAYREHLLVLLLDSKNHVIGINEVSVGDLSSSIANPREVFKAAVIAGAASIILCHNHPSGDPTPSKEDVGLTRRLMDAGKILGIEVLDHIIIGDNRHISLKEQGKM